MIRLLSIALFITTLAGSAFALPVQDRIDRAHTISTSQYVDPIDVAGASSAPFEEILVSPVMAQDTKQVSPEVTPAPVQVAPVANEPVPVPEVVAEAESAVPTPDSIDSFGDLVVFIGGYIEEIVIVAIAWALRKLPAQLYAVFVTARWEQIARSAIKAGINGIKNAVPDGPLEMSTGIAVLDLALVFVLKYAPSSLVKWVGGPEAVAEKLWARLDLAKTAGNPNFAAIALKAEQAVKSS